MVRHTVSDIPELMAKLLMGATFRTSNPGSSPGEAVGVSDDTRDSDVNSANSKPTTVS